MGNETTYFPSKTPARGFYANTGQEVESSARFSKIQHLKTKELFDIIRRHNCGAFQTCYRLEIGDFTFSCLGKVGDCSTLAIRALNSMVQSNFRDQAVEYLP